MVPRFAASLVAALCTAAALAQTSTGQIAKPSDTGSSPVTYVYFSDYIAGHDSVTPGKGQTQIEGYSVAADGTLTEIPGSPFAIHDFPTQLCSNGKFLFASTHIEQGNNRYPEKMNSYWIGKNGALALSHVLGNANLINITLDHTGEVLYGDKAIESPTDLLSYQVRWSDGGLEYLGQVTAPDLGYGGAWLNLPVSFSSDNRFAYETTVYAYERTDQYHDLTRESAGNIFPGTLIVTAAPDMNLAGIYQQQDPNGYYLDYSVGAFKIASNGQLTQTISAADATPTDMKEINSLAMSPSGEFLAVSGLNTVEIFKWNATEPVTLFATLPTDETDTDASADVMQWDNSNHLFAYVGGDNGGNLYVWTVTDSGATEAAGSPHAFYGSISPVVQGPGLAVQSLTAQAQ
jgi:hypothetical protein